MTIDNDIQKAKKANALIDQGQYRQALALANTIMDPSLRAAILIDAGFGVKKSGSIREGVALLEELIVNRDKLAGSGVLSKLLFNTANGCYSIYQLRRRRRETTVPPNDDHLRAAKRYYREAISELKDEPPGFKSQLFTNYANCLSQFGRGLESIEYYDLALSEDPQNGIAAGNAGRELFSIARMTGVYFHDYIDLARNYLTDALGNKAHLAYGPLEAKKDYEQTLESIEGIISSHENFQELLSPAHEPQVSDPAKEYLAFCKNRSLLLNAWVGDPDRAPANTDEISFGPIITDLDDETTVPELVRILNEVKEAYATARYLLYLATTGDDLVNEISKSTIYFRIRNDDLGGLRIGLCKSAYLRAFDVLDKVARIVNVYFGIGKRQDYFWYVFSTKQSRGQEKLIRFVTPPEIVDQGNIALYALSDICIDYFESQHVDLKTIDHRRNLIAHDYLAVLRESENTLIDENEIQIGQLFHQTLNVLRLAKLSILYAVSSVGLAEQAKPNALTVPKHYDHDHGVSSEDFPSF